jgi:uncharacterized protein YcbK (DUF882 family)
MSKITENFSLQEFNSKCGRLMPNNVMINIIELAKNLQVLRDEVKRPITITSGYRSPEHNAKVGGAKNSQHTQGTAADIKVSGMTPKEVALAIEKLIEQGKMKQGGIGIYKSWVHYDIFFDGKNKRRW